MNKKILISFLIFLIPMSFLEQKKNNRISIFNNSKPFQIKWNNKNDHKKSDLLFSKNKENYIEIDNCWDEEDLPSQKRYCSSTKEPF